MVGKRNKREYRRVYEEYYGPIPKGHHIHHNVYFELLSQGYRTIIEHKKYRSIIK